MNDAFRGAVMLAAATALFLSTYLAISYLTGWLGPKETRPPVRSHALWMPVTFLCTALLAILTSADNAGVNADLTWKDWLRGTYSFTSIAGLAPLWSARRRANGARTERQSKRAEAKEATS